MTGGNGGLSLNLYVLLLSLIVGIGGLLHGISGKNFGWHVFNVAVVVHALNYAALLAYYLQ